MVTGVGILVLVLGLIAWLGQTLAFLAPSFAVKLGVLEPEAEIDSTLYIIEAKVEGLVDALLTWTLPASALLMILDHPLWPYLGIFGGGVFLYFSGLITLSRVYMKKAGKRVGSPASVRAAYIFGSLWALASFTMLGLAASHLSGQGIPMSILADLSLSSRISLFTLLVLIALITGIVYWAQIGCVRGKPFENPDGTKDDWQEQKVFYGIAWADILLACPISFTALVLIFLAPRWGFFLMGMVSFWFLWANVMTTVTSLRFENPKFTLQWFVVFPFGAVVGLSFLAWTVAHFNTVFGP